MQGNCSPARLAPELPELPIKPAQALGFWLVAAGALWVIIGIVSIGLLRLF
jgi:hypothetical protein